VRRLALLVATAGVVGLIAFLWWPNGEYKPIQPQERGTIPGAIAQFSEISTGRPALTPGREEALGGAPFEHKDGSTGTPTEEPTSTTPTTETTTTETSTTETSTTETSTTATTTPEATTTTP
jgi:cytoskeletal protein RodZ